MKLLAFVYEQPSYCFKNVCIWYQHSKGLAKLFVHYPHFGTSKIFFGQVHYDHFTCPLASIKFCYYHTPAVYENVLPYSTKLAHCVHNFFKIIVHFFNPFIPNIFSHPYQLDESISNFRVVGWYIFIFIQILKGTSVFKQWRT